MLFRLTLFAGGQARQRSTVYTLALEGNPCCVPPAARLLFVESHPQNKATK
jgi:hypothetical protein